MKLIFKSAVFDMQFWIAVIVGWLLCGLFWTKEKPIEILVAEEEAERCLPCVNRPCPSCKNKAVAEPDTQKNEFYRGYQWIPQSFEDDSINHWRMTSIKQRYGMTNEEPVVGINGMWRLEREEIESFLQSVAKGKDDATETKDAQEIISEVNGIKFKRMMRKSDPFFGVSYILEVESTRKEGHSSDMIDIRRKFISGRPTLIDIKRLNTEETIHVITPLSKVSQRFHMFMTRLEENIYRRSKRQSIRLIFVIFGEENSNDSRETVRILQNFQLKNPTANMEHIFVEGKFSRAVGLHSGAKLCKDSDLMLFLDVDLSITPEFLDRIRANTILHKSVVFPVMFSQFDPAVINDFTKTAWVAKSDGENIGAEKGFWIYYAFGVASMYKSDYLKVGGFRLDITGWGGEDVDLFKKCISDDVIDVMTTVDPDLIHVYHSRSCDVMLSPDQYRMCIGALSETIGSEIQIATLYLKNKEKVEHNK